MSFNLHKDHYLIEVDERINSYKNQIEKIKTELNCLKRGNSFNNNYNYNYNYSSSINPCSQNNNIIEENSKLKSLICCYEGQINSLNEKICKIQNILSNKNNEMQNRLFEERKNIEDEIKNQQRRLNQNLCDEKIELSEKLCNQKQEFENMKRNLEREICLRENKIEEIKKENCIQIEKMKEEFENQLKNIQNEMNNKNIELEKLIEKYNNNLKIISDLFLFFHQNIKLFNNSEIINCNGDDIKYDDNDLNKNLKCSDFIFKTLNNFICKILNDNKEMFELLLKDKNELLKNKEENNQIINENNCLKEQLNNFANQLKNQTQIKTINNETNDTNTVPSIIDYEGPINKLKTKINDLEKSIENQNYN